MWAVGKRVKSGQPQHLLAGRRAHRAGLDDGLRAAVRQLRGLRAVARGTAAARASIGGAGLRKSFLRGVNRQYILDVYTIQG
jgi:hypothetical protein